MKFGYFTLSDNHYVGNTRSANDYIRAIAAEAIHAERVGMHSVWIGEHHFSTLGVLSCPDIVLAYVAAVTERVRLAPAVNVLPLHHPIRVAEQWATLDLLSDGRVDFATGRGYDKREYGPLNAPYEDNTAAFAEGLDALHRLWTETEPVTHKGRFYDFENISITPKPVQTPMPIYVACFSRPSLELAARLGHNVVVAPFAAAMQFGGLAEMADIYHEACAKAGNPPGRMICSYFAHFADGPAEDLAARTSQVRYFQECCIHALPQDIRTAPPTYHYFVDMVKNMRGMTPSSLTDKCCFADCLTVSFPDCFARQAGRFPGLFGRFDEARAGCRTAVGASSRFAAPALRSGPSGDPPPSARLSASMAVSGAFGHGPIARRIVVVGA